LFSSIWRINAIVILLAGILAIGALAVAIWFNVRDATRTRHADNIANVVGEDITKSKAEIGNFTRIEGIEVLRAGLYVNQEYAFSTGSKEASSIRNYLFFDPAQKSTYWLKSNSEGLILSTHSLPEHDYGDKEKSTIAFIYVLVEKDSNNDGKLTVNDLKDIAISDATGTRFKVVLHGVERLNGFSLLKNGRALILYTTASSLKAVDVDLQSQKLFSNVEAKTINVSNR
jgi:hypothetical protein